MNYRIVAFIYLLARDHLPVGVLNGIAKSMEDIDPGEPQFTDEHLAAWARKFLGRIERPRSNEETIMDVVGRTRIETVAVEEK